MVYQLTLKWDLMKTASIVESGFSNYTVDSLGRIYNVKRKKYMSTFNNNIGYVQVSLTHDTQGKVNRLVHRLVAEAFIPNPDKFPDVDHVDGDKNNNKLSNLKWIEHAANVKKDHAITTLDIGAVLLK